VAFESSLRDHSGNGEMPGVITPEMLLFGRELITMNVIPDLHNNYLDDPSYDPIINIRNSYIKLKNVNSNLIRIYHSEFLCKLIAGAVDHRDRYKPVYHKKLAVGDLVLLVEPMTKQCNYPLGIVRSVEENSLGEVTSAIVFKGSTREKVFRHSSSLILLMHSENDNKIEIGQADDEVQEETKINRTCRSQRKAAIEARSKFASCQ